MIEVDTETTVLRPKTGVTEHARVATRFRRLRLKGLSLMVEMNHASLPRHLRVEASKSTKELLRIEVQVDYLAHPSERGFDHVFNYAPFASSLASPPWRSWSLALEDLADALLEMVLECGRSQNVPMREVLVRVHRPEIAGLRVDVESRWAYPVLPRKTG